MSKADCRTSSLREADCRVADLVEAEQRRQQENLDLIASENYCSATVREAMGSVLTDKYAEGYPGARWYGGCEHVDAIEELAIERAKQLFGGEHANVQPHAGSQANMSAYAALISPGAKVLGMSLSAGGHLTHGCKRNFSGQYYRIISYGVDPETGLLDYDAVARLAAEHRPDLIVAGASAYSRRIDFARFREIADSAGAYLLADMAHIAGLVAARLHPDPVPWADIVTSTTHKTLRGPRSGFILCKQEHARAVDEAVFPATQGGPMMHVIAAMAVAFGEAMRPEFKHYQERVIANARAMAQEFISRGFPVVSGGTDNHLLLVDLTEKGLSGKQAETWLGWANITVNKNAVPQDRRNPAEAGGIRIGTPALTTRGLEADEIRTLVRWITEILNADDPAAVARRVKNDVREMCRSFPVHPEDGDA